MPPALQNPFVLWFVLTAALAAAAYFGVRRELRVRAMLYGSFLIACLRGHLAAVREDGQPGRSGSASTSRAACTSCCRW